jgi:hypothetical protein
MNLHTLYASLNAEERLALASAAHVAPGYLWQIAKRWRGARPSLEAIQRLTAADPRLDLAELLEEFAAPRKKHRSQPHGCTNV